MENGRTSSQCVKRDTIKLYFTPSGGKFTIIMNGWIKSYFVLENECCRIGKFNEKLTLLIDPEKCAYVCR